MIQWIRDFCELVSDAVYGLRCGWSFRFVLANFIMHDELREVIAFARINIERALEYCDISPEFVRRKLKRSSDDLHNLFSA